MGGDLILAIDNGTQSVRALLFDPRGTLLDEARIPIEAYYSDSPGLAEQNPEVLWSAVCQACHELWSNPDISRASIAAVAEMTLLGDLFEPNPSVHGIYDGHYRRVCRRRHSCFQPLYDEIRAITGCPSP